MKTLNWILAFWAVTGLAFSTTAAPSAGSYQVDQAHSKVGFEVAHLVISTVEGRFKEFNAQVKVGRSGIEKIDAEALVDSIDTDHPKRDGHLKSADFFDAAKHPKLTFKSAKVSGDQKGKFKIEGDLTLRGVTKRVAFDAKFLGQAKDPWGKIKYAYKATTQIDRRDFGLKWNKMVEVGPTVGNEVEIELIIQLVE